MTSKEIVSLAKRLKFPAGTKFDEFGAYWSKAGGLAGTQVLDRVYREALAAGFKPSARTDTSSPDASSVGNFDEIVDAAGTKISFSSTYGVTKSGNYFSISLTVAL